MSNTDPLFVTQLLNRKSHPYDSLDDDNGVLLARLMIYSTRKFYRNHGAVILYLGRSVFDNIYNLACWLSLLEAPFPKRPRQTYIKYYQYV